MTKESDSPEHGRALFPSNDTARIAKALRPAFSKGSPPGTCSWTLTAAAVEGVIRARALRSVHIHPELLGDPAWDMLLELFHAELTSRIITPAMLCTAGGVRAPAGLRWIDALVRRGLCVRTEPEGDRGSVRLSDRGSKSLKAYFAELMDPPRIPPGD